MREREREREIYGGAFRGQDRRAAGGRLGGAAVAGRWAVVEGRCRGSARAARRRSGSGLWQWWREVARWRTGGGRRTPVRLCGGAVGDGAGGGGWGVGRGCVVWLGAGALGSWVRVKGFGLVGWATINE